VGACYDISLTAHLTAVKLVVINELPRAQLI